MRRRTLLAAVAASGASAVAGCLDTGPADGDAPGGGGTTTDGTTTGTTDGTTDGTTAEGTTTGKGTTTHDTATETTRETTDGADATGTTTDETTTGDDAGSGASLADSSFTVRSNQCGQSRSSADVSFPDERTVQVRGVAVGSNGCYRARLADASVDAEGTLVVLVETYLPEDSGVCSQCLVDIEYTAAFTFEDGLPGSVEVHHDEERVTTAEPDG